jgi:guanylate kinase
VTEQPDPPTDEAEAPTSDPPLLLVAPVVFVVSGPSGTGKGTIVDALLASDPTLWLSRSWTTRARRRNESPYAYQFVDRSTFEAHVAAGGFLEYAEVFGHLYGTPIPTPPVGSDVVLEIDVQGAQQVEEKFPDAVLIFVEPPNRAAQEERLRSRGDDEATIARRLAKAEAEEEIGHRIADHIVINDALERAVGEVAGIVVRRRGDRRPCADGQPGGGDTKPTAVPSR